MECLKTEILLKKIHKISLNWTFFFSQKRFTFQFAGGMEKRKREWEDRKTFEEKKETFFPIHLQYLIKQKWTKQFFNFLKLFFSVSHSSLTISMWFIRLKSSTHKSIGIEMPLYSFHYRKQASERASTNSIKLLLFR